MLIKSLVSDAQMGIEFRESSYTLTVKNNKELRNGMILNLAIGFSDLENPKPSDDKSKTFVFLFYSLLLVLPVII